MAGTKYEILDPETGRLDPSIYTDDDIYRREMTHIFGRAWLLIGHESLIPNPGDFFHTYMGEDPVILSRGSDGSVNALLNMCRHRGARLVRADDGNCNNFVCSYHAWTYDLDGTLGYVPGEQEVYHGELDRSKLGLKRARVATYAGLIFATWAEDAPSLEDYLGDARWYLDMEFNRSGKGTYAVGPHKWIQPINWKTAVDNCSDWYHVPVSHASAANAMFRVLGEPRFTHDRLFQMRGRAAFVNGHQVQYFKMPEDSLAAESKAIPTATAEDDTAEAVERLGEFRAKSVVLGTHSLFPNTVLGFRLAIPRGPLKTEFWHFALASNADTPEQQREVLRVHTARNGVTGHFEADDVDNWRQVSESGLSGTYRELGQRVNLGLGHSHTDDVFPGMLSDNFVSENNHRFFYQRWQEFMNADSWADISLDPQKAQYEGTAGMNE